MFHVKIFKHKTLKKNFIRHTNELFKTLFSIIVTFCFYICTLDEHILKNHLKALNSLFVYD